MSSITEHDLDNAVVTAFSLGITKDEVEKILVAAGLDLPTGNFRATIEVEVELKPGMVLYPQNIYIFERNGIKVRALRDASNLDDNGAIVAYTG